MIRRRAWMLGILIIPTFARAQESSDLPGSWLSMNSVAFDTNAPLVVPERLAAAAPSGDFERVIVKFPGPATMEQHALLLRNVARVYCYLPQYAYLVAIPSGTGPVVASSVGASWWGEYHPAYKIGKAVAAVDERTAGEQIVMIRTFPDADLAAIVRRIQAMGVTGVVGFGHGPQFDRIRLLLSPGELVRLREDLARISDVFWIDVEPRLELLNDTTIWVGQSGVSGGQTTPVFSNGIYGEGQVVGIIDTGLDADMCYFRDATNGLPPTNACNGGTTINAAQRKVLAVDFLWQSECNGGINNGEWDTHGHGTHVAGTVGGDRGTPLIHDGGDGMAPGCKLVMQDGGFQTDNCADLPGIGCPVVDLNPLFQQAYDQGARLHTNSYGDNENAPVQNNYTAATEDVDQFMWNHKDFLIFFAAGNSGPGNDTVGSPSTAKSCISVGATYRGASAEQMAFFSSCGYTDDNRYKPEITIPGDSIVSAANDYNVGTNNCGTTTMSGTSMASPAAAGLSALVRQYYTDGFYPTGVKNPPDAFTPSAALVRATVVNSAQRMTGAGSLPGRCQGWGRILLDNALYFPGDARKIFATDDPGFPTGSTSSKDFLIDVVSGAVPFKVTLAWTDYPSTPAAMPHLVNDINLLVTAPDGTTMYKGNVFASNQSTTGGSYDARNTLEQVLLLTPSQIGTYTITVTAVNIPNGPQPYGLVVTGDITNTAPPAVTDDAIVGEGLGQPNVNRVRVYDASGTATAVDFLAYAAGQFGVNVSSGDIDGGAYAEILTAPGPGAVFAPQIRGFDRAGAAIAKVNFFAYGTLKYGANTSGANLDADATREILSGPGPGLVFGPHVRGWNYDGVSLSAMSKVSFFAYLTLKYGVNVEAGDVDGDGYEEIATGPGPGTMFSAQVRGFDYDGNAVSAMSKVNFVAFAAIAYGVNVASGNVDADPFDEIVAAPGPGNTSSYPSRFLGYNYDNTSIGPLTGFDVTPFATFYGGRVGLGDVTGDGQVDLLAGAGRDAAADSTVKMYQYTGSALTLLPGSFVPFGSDTYGVNAAGGALGY
ncbi:MAG: S8 family serine peptidase [Acidobacteriota bacterium]